MQKHDIHECDTHEHHGDEPGNVHHPHECDTHKHRAEAHYHAPHECDTHEHHGDEPGHQTVNVTVFGAVGHRLLQLDGNVAEAKV